MHLHHNTCHVAVKTRWPNTVSWWNWEILPHFRQAVGIEIIKSSGAQHSSVATDKNMRVPHNFSLREW